MEVLPRQVNIRISGRENGVTLPCISLESLCDPSHLGNYISECSNDMMFVVNLLIVEYTACTTSTRLLLGGL